MSMAFIFSVRTWVFLSIISAYLLLMMPSARVAAIGYEAEILLVNGVVLALSLFFSIYGTYNSESVREFLSDIKGDVIQWGISLASITYLYADSGFEGNSLPLWMLISSFAATTADLAFSLNGGASKLLEMDKENFRKDKG